MNNNLVLVTGGSGFVGVHCILRLLAEGYTVRTTVRSLSREAEVRAMLREGGVDAGERLSFVEADLLQDAGWAAAVKGCRYVLHVASPLLQVKKGEEHRLIDPAVKGTLRVLAAARDAGVERVVVTSSFAAVGYGHPNRATPFDERDWTNLEGADVSPYVRSKLLAERAAWEFMAREGGAMQMATVNPTAVLGPVLGKDFSESIGIVQKLLQGAVPACPRMAFGIVDVRDVAELHLLAMTRPEAAGQRFLAVSGPAVPMVEVSRMLRRRMGATAAKAPTREMPDWVVRMLAMFIPLMREIVPHLGHVRNSTAEKAKRMLGWTARSAEESAMDTAESLIRLGLV